MNIHAPITVTGGGATASLLLPLRGIARETDDDDDDDDEEDAACCREETDMSLRALRNSSIGGTGDGGGAKLEE